MENIVVLAVIGLIVGAAAGYIWREKRKGRKCIGCPDSTGCAGCRAGCGGCGGK